MTLDTLVFDLETQNFFTDPEVGWNNFAALRISGVGVYSYLRDEYSFFEEQEMADVARLFRDARRLVGFSINRYDIPVLQAYFGRLAEGLRPNLWQKERIDLLEELELRTGERVSLGRLAEANLGIGKERHGSEAIALYQEGRMDELKEYCLKDVELTKRLYDLSRDQGHLFMPPRSGGALVKVVFSSHERERTNSPFTTLF